MGGWEDISWGRLVAGQQKSSGVGLSCGENSAGEGTRIFLKRSKKEGQNLRVLDQ